LKNLDELARFSALYSDRVYMFNPLAKTASVLGNRPEHDSIEFRLELWDNLTVLVHGKRLIEAQLIVPFTPRAHLCPSCLAKAVFGVGEGTSFRSMQKDLEARLKRRLGVQVGIDGDDLVIELDGSRLGVDDHEPGIFVISPVPEFIVSDKELYAAMKEGGTATYPNKTLKKLKPHIFYSDGILEDIIYQMAVAYSVGSRFLTQGGLHAEALLSMAGDRRRRQMNRALLARLAIQLPIAADVPIQKLVELRDREQDAFVRFRAALNQVADAVRGEAERDFPRFAADIYDDIVRPRLAELNERVNAAKRDLVTSTLANAGGAMGVLCLGFFSGVLSADMTQVLQSLGHGCSGV
jgi:hypothetical protein